MASRSVTDIIESAGIRRLSVTPHGYKGCCDINPDHYDGKPSMYIHFEKGIVKCFSCGAFKPLFDYLLDKGATFDEAVDYLFTDFYQEKRELEGMKEWVLGRDMPASMIKRGFLVSTLKHFGVGYDAHPDHKHITIPLRYNQVLYGIKYRQYPKKFWYSEGFVKDNFIYNYEPTEERFYVEGETDTWRTWQNGTKNVSALLTSRPSDGQLLLMSKHKVINLALDNDMAGFEGAFRINRDLGREVEINVVPFSGKDAGDQTSESWNTALSMITNFTEFEVEMITRNPELYDQIQKRIK